MFWIMTAALVAVVGVTIGQPLWRGRSRGAEPAAAYDLRVYRDQLREVDRDHERGIIAPDDADRLRTEIGRKVLDADRRLRTEPAEPGGGSRWAAVAVLAVLLAGAVALYLREGAPGMSDQPYRGRLAEAQARYDARPTQAAAEAAFTRPDRPAPQVDEEFRALIARLRDTVDRNPDDPQGLRLLAINELRLGNFDAARAAQQRLLHIAGPEAGAEDLVRMAGMLIEAAGGLITAEAEDLLQRALTVDPDQPQARYLAGLLQIQNGRPDRAFPIWAQLLEQGPESAPWIAPIRDTMPELAWLAGRPDYVPPEPPTGRAPVGPDADDVAAAARLDPAARAQMVRDMVSRLEGRLAAEGGPPEDWARLIGALVVIGDRAHARDILDEARLRFAATPQALAPVEAAARDAGLIE